MAAILVTQRADDLIVDIGDRKWGLKRGAGRHGAEVELWWAARWWQAHSKQIAEVKPYREREPPVTTLAR
jgi:hypothetical protein